MGKRERKKCHNCKTLFVPNPRKKGQHFYCKKDECRKASKAASQKKWLNKPENRDYFCGPDNVKRVQEWRKKVSFRQACMNCNKKDVTIGYPEI